MFDRFLRHLASHGLTVTTFGSDDLESFFADIANRCAPGTTTRMRYAKLVDRLCRQLVELGVRKSNPAAEILRGETWPEDEPLPLFLDAGADLRLQAWVDPLATDSPRETRNRAVVALLLGSGIAAGELRHARTGHLVIDAVRSHIFVSKRGPRDERKISLPQFAEPALAAWQHLRRADSLPDTLLFSAPTGDKPINDMLLGMIVREALEAVDFSAPDMSPRVLRNTYARRHLLGGRSNEDVSRLLGLVSQRTVIRLRATLPASTESAHARSDALTFFTAP
jgi:site-specific recombinase XerC